MQQRYYDPIAGRFLSVDPVVTDANTGKGFGLYTYVDNNPYAKVDPDGRDPAEMNRIAEKFDSLASAAATSTPTLNGLVGHGANFADAAATARLIGDMQSGGLSSGSKTTLFQAAASLFARKLGPLPKVPTGPGTVPKSDRDPKRLFTPSEREAKRAEQGNQCANGCGTKIDESNSAGHHVQRHADGGKTTSENHAEVCNTCHAKVHSKEEK